MHASNVCSGSLAISRHAAIRMQQRGISRKAVEALISYGRVAHDHHGAMIVYFGNEGRRRIADEPAAQHYSRVYAVLSPSGEIVTVGYRVKRIYRH